MAPATDGGEGAAGGEAFAGDATGGDGEGVGGDGVGGFATGGNGGNAQAETIAVPDTTSQVPPAAFDRKIVRNATLEVTVQDVDQALGAARDAALTSGGFVFSSSTSYRGDQKYGQIVIQVPFDQFDAVMNALRAVPGLERIDSESTSSQDVTAEYVDTEARIRNLQATEQSYVTLLGAATEVQDIIVIQDYLSRVRGEIETLQGRIKYLDSVTSYSSISVSFVPVAPVPPAEPVAVEERNSLVEAVDESWEASLAVIEALGAGLVRVLVFSWWLLPILLIAYVVLRRRRERSTGGPATTDLPTAPAAPSGG
jgi:hypothetical protein